MSSHRGVRILLIESDAIVSECLSSILLEAGYEVKSTRDPRFGIQQALAYRPSLIITEVFGDDLGGLNNLQIIRALDSLAMTPIIVHSTLPQGVSVPDCLVTGADVVFEKPTSFTEIKMAIESLLMRAD